jgi:cell division protein ZipA
MGWNPSIGIPLIIAGIIVLVLIYLFGRPKKPGQGKRTLFPHNPFQRNDGRVEPTMGDVAGSPTQGELDVVLNEDLQNLEPITATRGDAGIQAESRKPPAPGVRAAQPIERIVTLFVAAREGDTFIGSSLIVAAEKAGLTFGDMGIFHRLLPGKPQAGPIFSMANMVKPGNFDMRHIDELRTPGVSFFMALPGPLSALDAWDAMLPTAQRLAELLNASVLDEERNALGRQRVAHIRDELRAYDRKQERSQIRLR